MPKKSADSLAKLLEQRDQLNARIQQEQAKLKQQERKKRDRSLVMWGVVVEAMLKEGTLAYDEWLALCERHLPSERNRDAARWLLQQLQSAQATAQEDTAEDAIDNTPAVSPASANTPVQDAVASGQPASAAGHPNRDRSLHAQGNSSVFKQT